MIIELIALFVLWQVLNHRRSAPAGRAENAVSVLLLLIVLTPLLQLFPLPPGLWERLPGRELSADVIQAISAGEAWRPISLDPQRTMLSAASLLPAAAMFLATVRLEEARRRQLAMLVIAGAVASVILGAFQVASDGNFHIYTTSHRNFATGLFANRNHQADLLLIAALLANALIWIRPGLSHRMRWGLVAGAALLFGVGVVATGSRTGAALLSLVVIGSLVIAEGVRVKPLAVGVGLLSLTTIAVLSTGAGQRLLTRYGNLSDARFQFWTDTLVAAREYAPWGSGLGTFASVYQVFENLDAVGPAYANHAHNEYLQILLEAGALGLLLLLLGFAAAIWLAIQVRGRPLAMASSLSILAIFIHSAVDYPLRMLSLMAVFGLLWGNLVSAADARSSQS